MLNLESPYPTLPHKFPAPPHPRIIPIPIADFEQRTKNLPASNRVGKNTEEPLGEGNFYE